MKIKSLLTIATLVVLAGCSLGPKAPEANTETTTETTMPTDQATVQMPAVEETQQAPTAEETQQAPTAEETTPEAMVMPEATTNETTDSGAATTDTVNVEIVPNPEY